MKGLRRNPQAFFFVWLALDLLLRSALLEELSGRYRIGHSGRVQEFYGVVEGPEAAAWPREVADLPVPDMAEPLR